MMDQPHQHRFVIDVTDENFQQEVIDRSYELPVVVDFWAAWCQPCRVLGPVLEGLAEEYAGQFLLAKADTEKTPQFAGQFRVQSIPAVYGLRDGQPVDFFVGVMPEAQLRPWLERLLPTEAESLTRTAKEQLASDPAAAERELKQAIEIDSEYAPAKIALMDFYLNEGRLDEARSLLSELEKRGYLEPEAEKLKAALELKSETEGGVDLSKLQSAAEQNPDDLAAQLAWAKALAGASKYDQALPILLSLVERDRHGIGEQARPVMLDIFQVLPADSELVNSYRRKLSMALY